MHKFDTSDETIVKLRLKSKKKIVKKKSGTVLIIILSHLLNLRQQRKKKQEEKDHLIKLKSVMSVTRVSMTSRSLTNTSK